MRRAVLVNEARTTGTSVRGPHRRSASTLKGSPGGVHDGRRGAQRCLGVFDLAVDVVGRLFLDAGDMNYAQRDITADCLVDRPSNRIGGGLRAVHADDHCGG